MKKELGSKKFSTVAFQIGSCSRRAPHPWPWLGLQITAETSGLPLRGPQVCSCPSAGPLIGRRCNAEGIFTGGGNGNSKGSGKSLLFRGCLWVAVPKLRGNIKTSLKNCSPGDSNRTHWLAKKQWPGNEFGIQIRSGKAQSPWPPFGPQKGTSRAHPFWKEKGKGRERWGRKGERGERKRKRKGDI